MFEDEQNDERIGFLRWRVTGAAVHRRPPLWSTRPGPGRAHQPSSRRVSDNRSSVYRASPSSPRRVGQWDGRDTGVGAGNESRHVVWLFELPGGREHASRRRLTIVAALSARSDVVSPTVRHRRSARIVVSGELDSAVASASVDGWCCLDSVDDVTVDLSAVTIMTSAGLGFIERLDQRVRARGGCFGVENPSPIVRRLLDIVDFDAPAPEGGCWAPLRPTLAGTRRDVLGRRNHPAGQ